MNTDRIDCDEAREKLPLYIGGDLDAGVLEAVGTHLDGCPACAALADEASRARRALVHALRDRATVSASENGEAGLWLGIRETLQAEGLIHAPRPILAPQPAPPRTLRRWARVLVPLAAAGLLAAVQLGGLFSGPATGGGRTVAPSGGGIAQAPSLSAQPLMDGALMDGAQTGGAQIKLVALPGSTAGGLQRVEPTEEHVYLPQPYRVPAQRGAGAPAASRGIRTVGFRPREMK